MPFADRYHIIDYHCFTLCGRRCAVMGAMDEFAHVTMLDEPGFSLEYSWLVLKRLFNEQKWELTPGWVLTKGAQP